MGNFEKERGAVVDALTSIIANPQALVKSESPQRSVAREVLLKLMEALPFDTLNHSEAAWQAHRLTWDDRSPLELAEVQRWVKMWS